MLSWIGKFAVWCGTRRLFRTRPTAAAACLAAVLTPLNMPARTGSSIAHVDIDGEHLYFACNNGCSPEGTLETFKTLLVNCEQ